MRETPDELAQLQALLDTSHASATEHLRSIISTDRRLTADDLVALLTGMRVISLATVTEHGEPRISAVDGHFLHGTWWFSTSGTAAKARHMAARPAVSISHVDGEELAVFSHGRVTQLHDGEPAYDDFLAYCTDHYGESPLGWGDDIRLYWYRPHWLVGYAFQREELLARRGVTR